jgi:nitroreductase
MDARELLVTRRSVRQFTPQDVTDELLWQLFEVCRWAPTSRNSQSYSYVVIRDRATLAWLASLRGPSSAPIARAPLALAVSADPALTKRPTQDGCIAAYHLLLAAHLHGLGCCWIAAMDRDDVKSRLGIPAPHYLATVTPLGFPAETPEAPARRPVQDLVRFLPPA